MKINHSSIGLLACPRKFQLRVLREVKDTPSESMLIGSAVHALIELYQRTGRDVPTFMQTLPAHLKTVTDKYGIKDAPSQGKVMTAFLGVTAHVSKAIEKNGTLMCEYKFETKTPTGIEVIGTIDEVSEKNGAPLLTDWKTTSYVTMADVIVKYTLSSQLLFYSYAYYLMYDEMPQSRFVIIPFKKSPVVCASTPVIRYAKSRADELITRAAESIQQIEEVDRKGGWATPVGMASQECHRCPYKTICHSTDIEARVAAAPKEKYEPHKFR